MKVYQIIEAKNKKDLPKQRNPHSNDLAALRKSGAMGAHKDKKSELPRKQKHKGKAFATEEYQTGPAAQAKGKGPMPKKTKPSRTGEQKHPLHGKLVGS